MDADSERADRATRAGLRRVGVGVALCAGGIFRALRHFSLPRWSTAPSTPKTFAHEKQQRWTGGQKVGGSVVGARRMCRKHTVPQRPSPRWGISNACRSIATPVSISASHDRVPTGVLPGNLHAVPANYRKRAPDYCNSVTDKHIWCCGSNIAYDTTKAVESQHVVWRVARPSRGRCSTLKHIHPHRPQRQLRLRRPSATSLVGRSPPVRQPKARCTTASLTSPACLQAPPHHLQRRP